MITRSDAGLKICDGKIWNSKTFFLGRSVMRFRKGRSRPPRIFRTERPISLPIRIGSVIRKLCHAAATTWTIPEMEWSSRTRPVNRLQATGEPRRVMRVGSKGYMLGSKEQDSPTRSQTGKAAAFTKEQKEKMSYYRDVYLKSDDWKNLRLLRLLKSNYVCAICAVTSECLDVHHVNYRNLHDVQTTDLRALCRPCHNKVHALMKKYPKLKKEQNNIQWRTVQQHLSPFLHGKSIWNDKTKRKKIEILIKKFVIIRKVLRQMRLTSPSRLKWTDKIFELKITVYNPVRFLNDYVRLINDARCRPSRMCQKLLPPPTSPTSKPLHDH